MLTGLGLPPLASLHGATIDHELWLVHLLMAVLGVGWGMFLVFTLVRYRRGSHPVARRDDQAGRGFSWKTAVVAGELAVVAVLLVPTYTAKATARPEPGAATEVRVVAEQFAWNVHYPGADGRFGRGDIRLIGPDNPLGLDPRDPDGRDDVVTINQFNMPVGRPVIVHLTSKDVIHSLGLPQMRVKQDAIPGMVQDLWFTPVATGNWEIACSQLCGLGHYRMRGYYSVQTPEAFAAWLADAARH